MDQVAGYSHVYASGKVPRHSRKKVSAVRSWQFTRYGIVWGTGGYKEVERGRKKKLFYLCMNGFARGASLFTY